MNMFLPRKIYSFFLLIILAACSAAPPQTTLMEEAEITNVSAYELQLRMNEFAVIFSSSVEKSADRIIESTNDNDIKQKAMLWKMYAIPAAYKAVFSPDPLASLIDTWAFCVQMRKYFQSAEGRELFGDFQSESYETAYFLEDEIKSIAELTFQKKGLLASELSEEEIMINEWTDENPIDDPYLTRRSAMELLAVVLGRKDYNIVNSVGSMSQNIEEMKSILNIYASAIPAQVRWQAEYMMSEYDIESTLTTLTGNLEKMNKRFDDLVAFTATTENMLDKTLNNIETQRNETIDEMKSEIEKFKAMIVEERMLITTLIENERTKTMEDVKSLSDQAMAKAAVISTDAVDHFFIRLIQLLLIVGAVILITMFIFNKSGKRKLQN